MISSKEPVRDIMTLDPVMVPAEATVQDVATVMRDLGIGDVLVGDGAGLAGVLTDRDLVIRALADGVDINSAPVSTLASGDPVTVAPDTAVKDVVDLIRDRKIRRIPVVESGQPVGIVSMGDLAIERDPGSALADVSSAEPNG